MYYVYVLFSLKDRRFYVGFSRNVDKRVQAHNASNNISTRTRRPLKLIYYEAHFSKEDALRRERYFKTSKGKKILKQMLRVSLNSFG